jgi:hypothetical protein
MVDELKIDELWCLKITASDLYNIERIRSDNPVTGGGHTYIQVPRKLVDPLLTFLRATYPPKGIRLTLNVNNRAQPDLPGEPLEFWRKSEGRMRIARQNRHRQSRLRAWSPREGFPSLGVNEGTADAAKLLESIGGLHIYLARAADGAVWAGYTTGRPSKKDQALPFANIMWGDSPGGYWRYKESTR